MAQNVHKLKTDDTPLTGLDLLRKPFEPNQISKLPKPTKRQTDEVKANFKNGIRCKECGAWHHPDVVHLDYVGHAALTDRLLDCDPNWNWEPVGADESGAPLLDRNGGMWIRLTVCGVTRLGYGHPDGKSGGDAIKETIGDALRNAAMRFGAALDLWHKGVLHIDDGDETNGQNEPSPPKPASKDVTARAIYTQAEHDIRQATDQDSLKAVWTDIMSRKADIPADWLRDLAKEKDALKAAFGKAASGHVEPDFSNLDTDPFPGDPPKDEAGYTAADYLSN